MRVLFLDIDGVLNRTGYRPDASVGLRSWIERDLAQRLSAVLQTINADIVLSSDWRLNRELAHLREELAAAHVAGTLLDKTPTLAGEPRWREIESWMTTHDTPPSSMVIVDDGYDMGGLASRFVRASPLSGFDDSVAAAIVALFEG